MQTISQIAIFIFGVSAIWLVGRKESWRRWGFIMGLIGQPFWIYSFITNNQYGMLCMTAAYTYSWAMGVYNFWIKKEKKKLYCDSILEFMDNDPRFQVHETNQRRWYFKTKGEDVATIWFKHSLDGWNVLWYHTGIRINIQNLNDLKIALKL